MILPRTIGRLFPYAKSSVADIDTDIRDELEFHLAMRTEENLRLGMSPTDAVRDARHRFGDFEQNRRACRNIDLGLRRWIPHAQAALVVLLFGVIVFQAVAAMQFRVHSAARIEALTRTIQRLEVGEAGTQQAGAQPIAAQPIAAQQVVKQRSQTTHDLPLPANWSHSPALAKPWSDWSELRLFRAEPANPLR